MKKFEVAICILILAFIFSDCKKKDNEVEPEPVAAPAPVAPPEDPYPYSNDLSASKDISFATKMILDIDLIASLVAEEQYSNAFFQPTASSMGTVTVIKDVSSGYNFAAFNKATCLDGKVRDGTIIINSSEHYSDFGYSGKVILSEYHIDNWLIKATDPAKPMYIKSKMPNVNYNPTITRLTWELTGNLTLIPPVYVDSTQFIIWNGTITKTLINSTDPAVYAPDKKTPVNWNLAKLEYSGSVTGKTSKASKIEYTIDLQNPIKRDFSCSFSTSSTVKGAYPFISGQVTLKQDSFQPRTINYGPDQNCDNSGTITFNKEVYPFVLE